MFLEEGSLSSFARRGSAPRFSNQFANFCRAMSKEIYAGRRGCWTWEGKERKKEERNSAVTTRVTWKRRFARNEREKRTGEINIHCSLKNSFQFFSPSLSLSLHKRISYLFIFLFFFFSLSQNAKRTRLCKRNERSSRNEIYTSPFFFTSFLPFFLTWMEEEKVKSRDVNLRICFLPAGVNSFSLVAF